MTTRCQCCEKLFLSDLVALAQKEFTANEFPQNSFYQHHSSFDALEQAANDGCNFCQLVLECFKGTPSRESTGDLLWPKEWLRGDCDVSESMYAEAKDLDESSIKIAINSTHVYATVDLDAVEAFDALLVRVGPNECQLDPFDDDSPILCLTLSTPREKPIKVGNFRIGRFQAEHLLGSEESFNLARSWLKGCRESHPYCSPDQVPELPSRVIDVGSGYGLGTPRVFLSRGKRAEYFTLSHCWGGKISPLLTTETLEPFQVALPYSRLPINFKDAIKITRQLGCRYLWIDSLCIIQDSKQDWQQESKKMGSYYGSSTMTICAMASAGSTSGILNPAPRIRLNPKPATLRVFPDGNQECEVVVQRMDLEEETLRGLGIESPLGSRGWTLQESILSPRNLFYGSQYIYWKCLGGCQAADGSPEGTRFPDDRLGLLPALHDTIPKELQSETLDVQTLLTNYHDLVSDYCYRKISFDSDKLPAFSGLARRLHPHIGGDYLAGIWSSDLRRALLWQAEMTYARHVKSYRAPSWSWAVTNEFVATVRHGLPPSLRGLRVVDYNVTPRDRSNPYGELEGATLVVEGLVAPLTRSLQVASSPDIDLKETIGTAKFDDPYGDEELNNGASINLSILLVSADDTDHLVTIFVRQVGSDEGVPELEIDCSKYVKDKYLALLVHVTDCTEDGFVKEDGVYYAEGDVEGLIIRQVDNEEGDISTFQRVGIVRFTGLRILWLDTWDRKTVTLV